MSYKTIANSPLMWYACLPIVILAIVQVTVFVKMVLGTADLAGISRKDCFKAFRTGMLSAIGPSIALFIVMTGLLASIGAPMAFMRISIGAEDAELLHAGLGAAAVGQKLGSRDYNMMGYAASAWSMATRAVSWIITAIYLPRATRMQQKMNEKDNLLLKVTSAACMIGIMTFMSIKNIITGWDMTAAAFASAICMLLLFKVADKWLWLKEYQLGISMIVGMLSGMLVSSL